MGTVNNEVVIATVWSGGDLTKIKTWISENSQGYESLFAFVETIINGDVTVIMGPDGSKKGWSEAKAAAEVRKAFIEFIKTLMVKWVEVGYGEYGQAILQGNNKNCYGEEDYAGSIIGYIEDENG